MIKLISTDFDGTLWAEFEDPPVPMALQNRIAELQKKGVKWVINTGRDLSSLMESLGRARMSIKPDFLVLVEREIYRYTESQYLEDTVWNGECSRAHADLFECVKADVPGLRAWVEKRFDAIFYADDYSPFCLIAGQYEDAEVIHKYLNEYCRTVPHLSLACNDVSARFSHDAYNKGTALAEVARQIGVTAEETFAAGDHLNDVPMLAQRYARWLAAPANAIVTVKELVRGQKGFVSELSHGHGVNEGLEFFLKAESTK